MKKAICMLVNDLHVGKDCIPDFKLNWQEAISICQRKNIPELIIGGDLFLSRSSQSLDVLLAVRDAFEQCKACGIHVTVLNGNHDKVDQENDRGYCHLYAMEGVEVVDGVSVFSAPGASWDLHLIGYYPEAGSFRDKLKQVKMNPDRKNYLYIHEGVAGALGRPVGDEVEIDLFSGFDQVFAGHYHNRCKIGNVHYIGSSRQMNFGEDEDKGYTVVYSDGDYEFVKNEVNTRYTTLRVPVQELAYEVKAELKELYYRGYKVRLQVTCQQEEVGLINKMQLIDAGASKVEIVTDETEVRESIQSDFTRFDKSGIIETYQQFCRSKQYSDEVVEKGLFYLSKIV